MLEGDPSLQIAVSLLAVRIPRSAFSTISLCVLRLSSRAGNLMVQAYCVKCKAKREMKDAVAVTLKNGKPAMKGKCPVCGTTIMRIGAAK